MEEALRSCVLLSRGHQLQFRTHHPHSNWPCNDRDDNRQLPVYAGIQQGPIGRCRRILDVRDELHPRSSPAFHYNMLF